LSIGLQYADKCPIDYHIPQYLIIAGAAGLGLIAWSLLSLFFGIIVAWKQKSGGGIAICLLVFSRVNSILYLLLLGWFIAGCYWILYSWDIIQYDDPSQENYCHPVLYRFAFCLLLISLIFKI